MPKVVESEYGGKCASCGEKYEVGEDIYYSDEDGGWIPEDHDLCLPDEYYQQQEREEKGW